MEIEEINYYSSDDFSGALSEQQPAEPCKATTFKKNKHQSQMGFKISKFAKKMVTKVD